MKNMSKILSIIDDSVEERKIKEMKYKLNNRSRVNDFLLTKKMNRIPFLNARFKHIAQRDLQSGRTLRATIICNEKEYVFVVYEDGKVNFLSPNIIVNNSNPYMAIIETIVKDQGFELEYEVLCQDEL